MITDDPKHPGIRQGPPGGDAEPVPQNEAYLVKPEGQRAAPIRPYRNKYIHTRGCGAVTTMDRALSETYAADPHFYGATYCVGCRMHKPVGEDGEFDWIEADGTTGPRVGT